MIIMNKGVSLIVLIITIIVIIILAGSVILSLSQSNPILSAQEATFKSDVTTMQTELDMYITKMYAQELGNFDPNTMNGQISDFIPSVTKYDSEFEVVNGKLIYKGADIQILSYVRKMDLDITTDYDGTVKIVESTTNVIDKNQGTVEAWVNVTSIMRQDLEDKYIFSTYVDEKYTNTLALRHTRDNKWQAIMSSDYNNVTDISVVDTLNEGWHLFSVKWNSSEFSLFIDGVKVATTASPKLMQAVSTNLNIGSGPRLNLVNNGYVTTGSNTNFLNLTYTNSNYYSSPACFIKASYVSFLSNDYIEVDSDNLYNLSGYFKSVGTSGLSSKLLYGVACYDKEYKEIGQYYTTHYVDTETELAQNLNSGDTIVYLKDASNWNHSTDPYYERYIAFSNYQDYPDFAYTRNSYSFIESNQTNNTVTLSSAYTGQTIVAGTKVANYFADGGSYRYCGGNGYVSITDWSNFKGNIQYSNKYNLCVSNTFRYATKYIKIMMLLNHSQNDTYATLVDDIEFKDMTDTIFNSKIQEVCISNIARTDSDILNRYTSGILTKDSNVTYLLTEQ